MKLRELFWTFFILLFISGCEKLEDTYSDYAGDGTIRYLGKCKNIEVTAGWNRLIVQWENHVDPAIDKIKVSWIQDSVSRDTLLEKGTTECSISNVTNSTYEVVVQSVDKDGNCSLPIRDFRRPFTPEHESILALTRPYARYFFVRDRLIVVFNEWPEENDTQTLCLNYYSGGQLQHKDLEKDVVMESAYYMLEDPVDEGTGVTITYSDRLNICPDKVDLNYSLDRNQPKVFSSDFKRIILQKTGQSEITEELINSITELEIDYNLETFEDILLFPQLKKLTLGSNRYLSEDYLYKYDAASEVRDIKGSIFALQAVHDLYGVEIFCYNNHYFPDDDLSEFMTYKEENPAVPENIEFKDPKDWKFTVTPEDEGWGMEDLFFNEEYSYWQSPTQEGTPITYELVADMLEQQAVQGVFVSTRRSTSATNVAQIPKTIQIKVSTDQQTWQDATYVADNTIGDTAGEITLIRFPKTQNVRYIKFIVKDVAYNDYGMYRVTLSQLKVF